MKKFQTLTILIILNLLPFLHNALHAQYVYANPNENVEIGDSIYLLEDKTNRLAIEEIVASNNFEKTKTTVPNFGITSSSIWVKVSIQNKTKTSSLILQLNQAIIDEVDFYSFNNATKQFDVVKRGEYQTFDLRKYLTPDYLFDLNIPFDSVQTIFMRIQCKENMQLPLFLGTPYAVFNNYLNKNIASGIYMGIMIVMILYNLFIFGIFREKSYIYYAIYIVLILFTQTSLQGFTFQFVWPNVPWLTTYSPFLLPALVGMAGLEFFKDFLHLDERNKKAYKFSFLFIISYILSMILGLSGYFATSFKLVEITASGVSIFMLINAYKIYKQGNQEARFFLVGWSIFLIGICIYVLKDFEVLPYNNFTRYTMHFGSGMEVILLSFALADKINILKKEKELSQAEALRIAQEKQVLIQQQNIILEKKVEERTLELKETNSELNITLFNLKEAQAQLVNAEKMASLGQLTAGIAHEINNPINFVSANIKPLQLDIQDLISVIEKYETLNSENAIEPQLKEINSFKKEIDMGYVINEIKVLLGGIEDGAKRTAEIVKGLKNFSRLDETDIKGADINEGIESTLLLLRSSISESINIELNLGKIPTIQCYPGKLNQVFMNVLNNAIQAMDKRKINVKHKLSITSALENDYVVVKIEDTGIGMSAAVKEKIFEPFFTTKDVGEGTGLGMSIVYKIIESHNGKIEIYSEPDKGTKVMLYLPLVITR
jgi:signal transduction histidine kinase